MPHSPRLPHKVPVIQAKLKRKCALFQTVVACIQDLSVRTNLMIEKNGNYLFSINI